MTRFYDTAVLTFDLGGSGDLPGDPGVRRTDGGTDGWSLCCERGHGLPCHLSGGDTGATQR